MTADELYGRFFAALVADGETGVTRHADGTTTWTFRPARERPDDDEHQALDIVEGARHTRRDDVRVTDVSWDLDAETGDVPTSFAAVGRSGEVPDA